MTKSRIASKKFDYGRLDGASWKFVQDARDKIRRLGKQTAENIIAIGRHLTEVRERLPYGQYGAWLEAEFPSWSERHARRFMNSYALASHFGHYGRSVGGRSAEAIGEPVAD